MSMKEAIPLFRRELAALLKDHAEGKLAASENLTELSQRARALDELFQHEERLVNEGAWSLKINIQRIKDYLNTKIPPQADEAKAEVARLQYSIDLLKVPVRGEASLRLAQSVMKILVATEEEASSFLVKLAGKIMGNISEKLQARIAVKSILQQSLDDYGQARREAARRPVPAAPQEVKEAAAAAVLAKSEAVVPLSESKRLGPAQTVSLPMADVDPLIGKPVKPRMAVLAQLAGAEQVTDKERLCFVEGLKKHLVRRVPYTTGECIAAFFACLFRQPTERQKRESFIADKLLPSLGNYQTLAQKDAKLDLSRTFQMGLRLFVAPVARSNPGYEQSFHCLLERASHVLEALQPRKR